MKTEMLQRMQSDFDGLVQTLPNGVGIEFWFARDLQEPLGYARWENFITAIQRAIESCETSGYRASDHFRGVTKLITHGNERQVWDHSVPSLGGFFADPDYCGQEPGNGNDESQRPAVQSPRRACDHR